jgi:hypothetical protein
MELQGLFYDLEHCVDGDDVLHVEDEDGETAFFRAGAVLMISVPLAAVKPKLWEAMSDEENEEPATTS